MKKSFKSLLVCTMVLLTGLVAVSCDNAAGGAEDTSYQFKPNPKHAEAIQKFGKNPVVFTASSRSGRFYTGQQMKKPFYNMYNDIYFEANLVQYDSLDATITEYVKNIESKNALMHQGYDNVKYIKGKTYVELASYTDAANGEIIMFDVRIFDGDFWNNKNEDGWYAKSVTFSPDFKIDVHKKINIITGNPEIYKYPHAITKGESNNGQPAGLTLNSVDEYNGNTEYKAAIQKIGDINKIFTAPIKNARLATNQIIDNHKGKKVRFEANLIEYNSIKPEYDTYFTNYKTDIIRSINQNYGYHPYDKSKKYIEFGFFEDVETKKIVDYCLRTINGDINEGSKREVKEIYLDSDLTITK